MVNFELILARFCDAFLVTIHNLLDFSIEVSKNKFRLYPVTSALTVTTEVVFLLISAWFSSYEPKTTWTNSLVRTIRIPKGKHARQEPYHADTTR